MGLTKSEIFTDKQNELAQISKALGHPARIAILEHLLEQNSCICNDLVDEIGLAQATISQHLKELKNLGIIQGTIAGKSMCYCINTERWNEIKSLLNQFLFIPQKKNTNCC